MKLLHHITALLLVLTALVSCEPKDQFTDEPMGNFNALWTIIDHQYCFFKYKNVDWDSIGHVYRQQVKAEMTDAELFNLCSQMLKELKDGHTNLISPWNTSRYWIWEQYPVNYDARIIEENYLHFNFNITSGMRYGLLPDSIGYIRYSSFASGVSHSSMNYVLTALKNTRGLIIDVRSNGGGLLTNVHTLVGHFITSSVVAGSIQHKTGPGHNDFSKPYTYSLAPAEGVKYLKPIVVLINRASYSATNNFASIMSQLPQVTLVGDHTGGGCGLPFTAQMPNGWSVRYSAAPIYDATGQLTEWGISPDVKVDITEADRNRGHDTILDTAMQLLKAVKD